MRATVIDPEYNWKQAAAQEGVDYDAVRKSFMDQAYGFVANKAKVLFQDPFRLGFEIVHRNEKATKMVGIFAFRCNNALLYAPVFFVNGEIKAADMLYRGDVKRFVPLTDEWCAFLVRGANQEPGMLEDKSRQRQPDAYMDRLAYPQRVKYAAADGGVDLRKIASYAFELIDRARKEAPDNPKGWLEDQGRKNPDIALDVAKAIASGELDSDPDAEFDAWKNDSNVLFRPTHISRLPDGTLKLHLEFDKEEIDKQMLALLERVIARRQSQSLPEAEKAAGSILNELLLHCASDEPMRKIMPDLIRDGGPDALEKLAGLIENSEFATRYLVENYTEAELTNVSGWQEKKAAEQPIDPEADAVVLVTGTGVCKSAAERQSVVDRGYALVDNRPLEKKSAIVEVIDSEEINELTAGCGEARLMMSDGTFEDAFILQHQYNLLDGECPRDAPANYLAESIVYLTKSKQMKRMRGELFGERQPASTIAFEKLTAADLNSNGTYIRLSADGKCASDIFVVTGKARDGECTIISFQTPYSSKRQMLYSPNRDKYSSGEFVSDDVKFLEVDAEIKYNEDTDRIDDIVPNWNKVPMDAAGIDRWMRTAGNLTESVDVEVKVNNLGLFDITARDIAGSVKVASDLGMLAAHLKLANDFELTCDAAGAILDKTVDDSVNRFRVFSTSGKSAFMTRMQSMAPWIESFDPELGVKLDAPQRQVVMTHTPERARQHQRYGDHWQRPNATPNTGEKDGLPADAIFSKSPEELAVISAKYNMPNIFDHGMLGQMASATFNTISQIQQYIPDLETGVDRYFRILFLLRYRPADFEEAYGKDELMEMEHEFSELASTAGANLLRLLKRLDLNKTTNQRS